jgi:flap endonuclease-1
LDSSEEPTKLSPTTQQHSLGMGIQGLTKLLSDETPGAIKEQELKNLTGTMMYFSIDPKLILIIGRRIAIDASMVMYQFLVAVRSDNGYSSAMLMNEAGEITSHIQGMFNRTIKLISAGIKPVYVFDGKPPGKVRR